MAEQEPPATPENTPESVSPNNEGREGNGTPKTPPSQLQTNQGEPVRDSRDLLNLLQKRIDHIGIGTWKSKDNDFPGKVTGYAGKGSDGREYFWFEGPFGRSMIPGDEFELDDSGRGREHPSSPETHAGSTGGTGQPPEQPPQGPGEEPPEYPTPEEGQGEEYPTRNLSPETLRVFQGYFDKQTRDLLAGEQARLEAEGRSSAEIQEAMERLGRTLEATNQTLEQLTNAMTQDFERRLALGDQELAVLQGIQEVSVATRSERNEEAVILQTVPTDAEGNPLNRADFTPEQWASLQRSTYERHRQRAMEGARRYSLYSTFYEIVHSDRSELEIRMEIRQMVESILEGAEGDPDKEFNSSQLGELLSAISFGLSDPENRFETFKKELNTLVYGRYRIHQTALAAKYEGGDKVRDLITSTYQDEIELFFSAPGADWAEQDLESEKGGFYRREGKQLYDRYLDFILNHRAVFETEFGQPLPDRQLQALDQFLNFGSYSRAVLDTLFQLMDQRREQLYADFPRQDGQLTSEPQEVINVLRDILTNPNQGRDILRDYLEPLVREIHRDDRHLTEADIQSDLDKRIGTFTHLEYLTGLNSTRRDQLFDQLRVSGANQAGLLRLIGLREVLKSLWTAKDAGKLSTFGTREEISYVLGADPNGSLYQEYGIDRAILERIVGATRKAYDLADKWLFGTAYAPFSDAPMFADGRVAIPGMIWLDVSEDQDLVRLVNGFNNNNPELVAVMERLVRSEEPDYDHLSGVEQGRLLRARAREIYQQYAGKMIDISRFDQDYIDEPNHMVTDKEVLYHFIASLNNGERIASAERVAEVDGVWMEIPEHFDLRAMFADDGRGELYDSIIENGINQGHIRGRRINIANLNRLTPEEFYIYSKVKGYRHHSPPIAWADAVADFMERRYDDLDFNKSCNGRASRELRNVEMWDSVASSKATSRLKLFEELRRFYTLRGVPLMFQMGRRNGLDMFREGHWNADFSGPVRSWGNRMLIARKAHDLVVGPKGILSSIKAINNLPDGLRAVWEMIEDKLETSEKRSMLGKWAKGGLLVLTKYNYFRSEGLNKNYNSLQVRNVLHSLKEREIIDNNIERDLRREYIGGPIASFLKLTKDDLGLLMGLFEGLKELGKQALTPLKA